MSYLSESYLDTPTVAPMNLPTELTDRLRNTLQGNPEDMIYLPGGIVMKRSTAIIIGIVILALVILYVLRQKEKSS